jgi:hypothetical protein
MSLQLAIAVVVGQFEKQRALLSVGVIPKPRKTASGYWLLASSKTVGTA